MHFRLQTAKEGEMQRTVPLLDDLGGVIWSLDERRGAALVAHARHLWEQRRHVVLAVVDVRNVEARATARADTRYERASRVMSSLKAVHSDAAVA